MDQTAFAALATGFLVLVGIVQAVVLVGQRRQHRLDLAEAYRRRWADCRTAWATLVYFGRNPGEYYQVADEDVLAKLAARTKKVKPTVPAVWALDAARAVSTLLSDVCLRILQGQLRVNDVYPVFGTELLRQSLPVRVLLDVDFSPVGIPGRYYNRTARGPHGEVRGELQDWLIYHDGIRRRCLVLLDLLWAEAARLEDLPPHDLAVAANAKRLSGKSRRKRIRHECLRLRGPFALFRALRLSRFLRHAEYRRLGRRIGLTHKRLTMINQQWTDRILHGFGDDEGPSDSEMEE
jgi:hypothetical protein